MRKIFLGAKSPEDLAKKISSHLGGDFLIGIKRGQTFLVFREGELTGKVADKIIPSSGDFTLNESFGRGQAHSRGSFFVVFGKGRLLSEEFLDEIEVALERAYLKEINEEMLGEIKNLFEKLRLRECLIFKDYHSKVTGAILSSLGHKINNKLTAIIGYAQMLLYEMGDNPLKKAKLERILENAHVISQKLQKAMVYFQDWECEYDDDLLNTLERSLERKKEIFCREGIKLLKKLEKVLSEFPVSGLLMELALEEVINNAVENLYEAKDKILKIEGKAEDQKAIIKFYNTVGSPVKDIEKAFEPFFTTKRGRWGLGLNLVHGIVTRVHGGSVDIWNEEGGVSLVMEIPRLQTRKSEEVGEEEVAILSKKHSLANLVELCLKEEKTGQHRDRLYRIKALISEEELKKSDFSAKLLFVEDPFVEESLLKKLLQERKVERIFVFSSKNVNLPGVEKINKEANFFDICMKIKEARWKS